MKLEGRITMRINSDGATITIADHLANIDFVTVVLSPEQILSIFGGLARAQCELNVFGIEKIGKKHENKKFEFQIPNELRESRNEDKLQELAQSLLSDGWVADRYFSSQDSFFKKDGVQYARCTIRRWA